MASAYITKRKTSSGPRWVVRFRAGGRDSSLRHAGSYKQLALARERKRSVEAELAAGRDPLAPLTVSDVTTVARSFAAFIASRVDVSASTLGLYGNARDRLGELAARDPRELRPADVQAWVKANSDLSPASLAHYLSTLRQVLDFAGVEPNPGRSRLVRLPQGDREEVNPPNSSEWVAMKSRISPRFLLALRLIECLGLRVGETTALGFGDVDFLAERIRVSRVRTKSAAGQRWLPVPPELLAEISGLCPLEDRSREREVFPVGADAIRLQLRLACRDAGIASYSPHDLRHRRISLWVAHGFDPVTVKTLAGHSKASLSLDTYSHVVIDAAEDEWLEFWLGNSGSVLSHAPARVPIEAVWDANKRSWSERGR